ncbi:hypothetical protein HRbin30_02493 [bacterium HR30]|nr:hypothetical protein HRbin30_02493 [bacterium HR30]
MLPAIVHAAKRKGPPGFASGGPFHLSRVGKFSLSSHLPRVATEGIARVYLRHRPTPARAARTATTIGCRKVTWRRHRNARCKATMCGTQNHRALTLSHLLNSLCRRSMEPRNQLCKGPRFHDCCRTAPDLPATQFRGGHPRRRPAVRGFVKSEQPGLPQFAERATQQPRCARLVVRASHRGAWLPSPALARSLRSAILPHANRQSGPWRRMSPRPSLHGCAAASHVVHDHRGWKFCETCSNNRGSSFRWKVCRTRSLGAVRGNGPARVAQRGLQPSSHWDQSFWHLASAG